MSGRRVGSLAAEFVLIVVGVLLALWVDSWRQGVEDTTTEAELLAALQADLAADSLFLAAERESLPRQVRAADALLRLDPDNLPDTDSLTRLDEAFAVFTPDRWSESAYRAMIEGGGLANIQDPGLSRALTEYYEGVLGRARIRTRLDQQAMDRYIETVWFEGNAFALADLEVDELLTEGNTAWVHQIDRSGYRDWLANNSNVILLRMDQRLLLLRHFRDVEVQRAALSRRITEYLSGD